MRVIVPLREKVQFVGAKFGLEVTDKSGMPPLTAPVVGFTV